MNYGYNVSPEGNTDCQNIAFCLKEYKWNNNNKKNIIVTNNK